MTAVAALALELRGMLRTPGIRSLSEFAEAEIVVPDGPLEGRRFRLDRHPAARLLFAEIDSGRWRRVFWTGPNQDGKTFLLSIVLCWLLFERRETVVYGVPTLDMSADKWRVLLAVIRASRYRDELPTSGAGSRGGEVTAIEFRCGPVLRFMTGGGDDQSRSAFTSRNLCVTEADGFDEVGGSSREGDKFTQLVKRTLAFGPDARVLAECTVSTEQGRVWQEYQRGSASRIAMPCPHCGAYVTPEREHLHGWQTAESEDAAADAAAVHCPDCGAAWTEAERIAANGRAVLVHRGQEVAPDGTVTGPPPPTKTLGFRWTAVNAVLRPGRLADVAREEWAAKRAPDEDLADRNLCQMQWVLPAKPAKADVSGLDAFVIIRRTLGEKFGRGVCPPDTQAVTVAADVGKRLVHWAAIAWRPNATPHVVDYGRFDVPSDELGEEPAILLALRDWRDELTGWKCGDRILRPTFAFVDAGNWQDTILQFVAESGPPFFGTKGYGTGQRREGSYRRDTGSTVVWTKDGYGLVRLQDGREYVEVSADRWKTWLHARVRTPLGQDGALTLFHGTDPNEHVSYAKHLTAERQVEQFDPKRGTVTTWQAVSRNNHWLDATVLACVAGHEAGVRLIEPAAPPAAAPVTAVREPDRERPASSNWATGHRGRY